MAKFKDTGLTKKIEEYKRQAFLKLQPIYKRSILQEIRGGRSPVKGKGRFKKYSDSYKDSIKGRAFFFQKDGSLRVISALGNKELTSLRASSSAKSQNSRNRAFLKKVSLQTQYGKRVSPVNMTLTGELLKSLKTSKKKDRIIIRFDSPLADIHNRRGAGKSKTVRRLLPTRSGETFNQSIQRDVREVLTRLANKIFK